MNRISIFLALAALTGCASVRVYDVPRVQQNFSTALQRSDEVARKAQNDYADKKALVDNMGKGGAKGYKEAEPELLLRLGEMEASLDRLNSEHKKMMAANSNVASLSYGHETIHSGAREFEKVDEEIRDFQASTAAVNLAMADYSKASNALTSIVEAKKLYMTFESVEFYKRLQQSVKTAQINAAEMEKEISRAQRLERGDPAAMEAQAASYTEKAQRLGTISKEMRTLTADARVTSLDAQWPAVQKLLNESDQIIRELEDLNGKFQKSAEELRASQKRSRR